MSEKKTIFEEKAKKNIEDVISFLRTTANNLEQGSFMIHREDKNIQLAMSKEVKLEIKIDEKVKQEGLKYALRLELEWYKPIEKQNSAMMQKIKPTE